MTEPADPSHVIRLEGGEFAVYAPNATSARMEAEKAALGESW